MYEFACGRHSLSWKKRVGRHYYEHALWHRAISHRGQQWAANVMVPVVARSHNSNG
jgi:hypothetical protein